MPPVVVRRTISLWWLLSVPVMCYAALFAVALLFADSLIFFPHSPGYRDTKDIIKLTAADGAMISARYLPNDSARFVLLYSHGNGEDLSDDLGLLKDLQRAGFAVFAYDYHGYGTSQGSPSEKAVYADIDAAYNYLAGSLRIPAARIIAYGRSLGGAAAVDLTVRKPVAGLIMESSFVTAFRVMTRIPLLPFDTFRNIDKIKRVTCPVLILHGDADRTIPFWHGEALYRAARQPKRMAVLHGGDHNQLSPQAAAARSTSLIDFAKSIQ